MKMDEKIIRPLCKATDCYLDCNKAAIVAQCDIRAYGLYLRLKKADMTTLLKVLIEMGETESFIECKRFL